MDHLGLEHKIKSIIGSSLSSVTYVELNRSNHDYHFQDIHTVDFGVELRFSNGDMLHFSWDEELSHFSIDLGAIPFSKRFILAEMQKWEVVKEKEWQRLLNTKVTDVNIRWDWLKSRRGTKYYVPQDLVISFSNGESVTLCVGEYENHPVLGPRLDSMPGGDIFILFTEEQTKKLRRGVHGVSTSFLLIHS